MMNCKSASRRSVISDSLVTDQAFAHQVCFVHETLVSDCWNAWWKLGVPKHLVAIKII